MTTQPITAQGTEQQLSQRWQQQLGQFWQHMQHGTFQSNDGLQLHYSHYLVSGCTDAIIISAGRVEMAIKYTELIHDFVCAGYSVFILDHRGQGASTRQLKNPHKGYVRSFDDYSDDLALFMEQIVIPAQHKRHFAICHSMGAAIACNYQQRSPVHPFDAMILASPMLGIHTAGVPAYLAESLVKMLHKLNRIFNASDSWYFPGQCNYHPKVFSANPLTSSEYRLQWMQSLYQQYPEYCLGGATTSWLAAAINVMSRLRKQAAQWQTPVLLLQGEEDTVVSNADQLRWWQQLPPAIYRRKHLFAAARHELFMENDTIRNQVLQSISQFLTGLPPK